MESKNRSLLALLLVGFVPSISVIFGIKIIDDELTSQIFFLSCKLWIFLIPTIWYLRVDGDTISKKLPSKDGLKMGLATGLVMSIIILITWLIFESTLEIDQMTATLQSNGLSNINLYILGMIYWIFLKLIFIPS